MIKSNKVDRVKQNLYLERIIQACSCLKCRSLRDSGLLSVIEIFCILPSIEQMLKSELRKLEDNETESCSEHYSESEDEVSIRTGYSWHWAVLSEGVYSE